MYPVVICKDDVYLVRPSVNSPGTIAVHRLKPTVDCDVFMDTTAHTLRVEEARGVQIDLGASQLGVAIVFKIRPGASRADLVREWSPEPFRELFGCSKMVFPVCWVSQSKPPAQDGNLTDANCAGVLPFILDTSAPIAVANLTCAVRLAEFVAGVEFARWPRPAGPEQLVVMFKGMIAMVCERQGVPEPIFRALLHTPAGPRKRGRPQAQVRCSMLESKLQEVGRGTAAAAALRVAKLGTDQREGEFQSAAEACNGVYAMRTRLRQALRREKRVVAELVAASEKISRVLRRH
jgi:hypothetical protein